MFSVHLPFASMWQKVTLNSALFTFKGVMNWEIKFHFDLLRYNNLNTNIRGTTSSLLYPSPLMFYMDKQENNTNRINGLKITLTFQRILMFIFNHAIASLEHYFCLVGSDLDPTVMPQNVSNSDNLECYSVRGLKSG